MSKPDIYSLLPSDLRLIVFDLEHEMGLVVGGGAIFNKREVKGVGKQRSGRRLNGEESMVRLSSLYIGNKHLQYPDRFLSRKFHCGQSLVNYANKVIIGYLETNSRFRKQMYNVAYKNGLMDLVSEIDDIMDAKAAIKEAFTEKKSTYTTKEEDGKQG